MSDVQELRIKRDKLRKIALLKEELPHLYGFPLYQWQEDFMKCGATFQFIFKANQIGGSSIMIKKLIDYATDKKKWARFKRKPTMFIYLYPDKNTATREWVNKWCEFMPRGSMKDNEQYGWKEVWDGKYIDSIEFNTGITMYFKTYGSGAENLQASTPAILACDEELPEDLWPELQIRITGSPANAGAMYWQGCTPTKGQKYLAKIQSGETVLPDSWVVTVSQYDCLFYANGDKSLWSKEKIQRTEQALPSQREIDVRINGLFKPIDSLLITQFVRAKHTQDFHLIKGWNYYAGIDYGVGGPTGHPSAISIVAVSPSFNAAKVIKCWKGDNVTRTTPDDVIIKYLEMIAELGITDMSGVYYDHSAGSLGIISERSGLGFIKANKARDDGYNLLNSLFKNNMLHIMLDSDGMGDMLVDEIESITADFNKKRQGDDLLDATRYALSSIPFSFENIKVNPLEKVLESKQMGRHETLKDYDMDEMGDEIDEWNEYYG